MTLWLTDRSGQESRSGQELSGEQEWPGVARSGQEWSGEQEPEDQDNCYPGEADKMSGRLINH